jgi:CheY-like chemotaxis protein
MKILLIDDDVFLRDMYSLKFSEAGHEVVAAENSAEAMRMLESDKTFSLLLVDMIMPGMSGVDFLKSVQPILQENNIKSIMLTNQSQDEDVQDAKEVGVIGYLIKAHLIPSEVVAKVEEIMSKNKS